MGARPTRHYGRGLAVTSDLDWQEKSGYYTTAKLRSTGESIFDLEVAADADSDYYILQFQVAGGTGNPEENWFDTESFYVHLAPEAGMLSLLAIGGLAIILRSRLVGDTRWHKGENRRSLAMSERVS